MKYCRENFDKTNLLANLLKEGCQLLESSTRGTWLEPPLLERVHSPNESQAFSH